MALRWAAKWANLVDVTRQKWILTVQYKWTIIFASYETIVFCEQQVQTRCDVISKFNMEAFLQNLLTTEIQNIFIFLLKF
ncbi:hypothetical protein NPIL_671521 [Nephila pilipes]|uniref:Uncharacterized protein n=1 Tax=Nephila pilipes TaxID=299642 RepID=A0A8X6TBP8_NEPPI|nr:hypothetical protein NPIL_671521 [Nephila pilipes]